MTNARVKSLWNYTSHLMAHLANINRTKKGRAFTAADFDPFKEPTKPLKVSVDVLRDVFIKGTLPTNLRRQKAAAEASDTADRVRRKGS